MSEPPALALAFSPVLAGGLLDAVAQSQLEGCTRLLDPEPLAALEGERAERALAEAEILLTGWGCPPLEPAVLARAPRLRAVVHAAGTVRGVVTEACWERGLQVSSAAAANAVPVAEFSLAAILFAGKRVFPAERRYAEERRFGRWSLLREDVGNRGRRVGLVGASRIGRRVRALLAHFDLEVALADPTLSEDEVAALGVPRMELDALLGWADIVSLHAPLLPQTTHLLDARRLALLRDGAVLVNTARGALVEGAALERELVAGRLEAVLDVTDPEPLPPDSPLYALPNVFLTPHLAGAQGNEVARLGALAVEEVERLARGEALLHEVRRADLEWIA